MGKIKSIWLRGSKGKLAGTTLYTTSGVTIQREIQTEVKNPRTRAQMAHRVRLANLVNMYQVAKRFFKYAFENKPALVSDYNRFVSLNLSNNPVFLTKQQAAVNVVVPAGYQITEGSLPVQATSSMDDGQLIGLGVPSDFEYTANTTVSQLTTALKRSHPEIIDGMQLSVIIFFCDADGKNLFFALNEVILDSTNTAEKVSAYIPNLGVYNGRLTEDTAQGADIAAGAFVLSHTVAGKTRVSTETMVTSGLFESQFVGDPALEMAINSYGESSDVFLDSNNANPADHS